MPQLLIVDQKKSKQALANGESVPEKSKTITKTSKVSKGMATLYWDWNNFSSMFNWWIKNSHHILMNCYYTNWKPSCKKNTHSWLTKRSILLRKRINWFVCNCGSEKASNYFNTSPDWASLDCRLFSNMKKRLAGKICFWNYDVLAEITLDEVYKPNKTLCCSIKIINPEKWSTLPFWLHILNHPCCAITLYELLSLKFYWKYHKTTLK